jgi:hypothetical protein
MPTVTHPQVWGGKGTLLQHGVGTGTVVWTTVTQRTEIDGPDGEMGTRETTNLDSTARTFASTIIDTGEAALTIEYDPGEATHTLLTGLYLGGTVEQFQLVFTDIITLGVAAGSTLAFNAIVTKFKPTGMTVEGNLMGELTLKGTGLPVFTKNS